MIKIVALLICMLTTPVMGQVVVINNPPTPIDLPPVTISSEQGPDIIVDPLTGSLMVQYNDLSVIATLIRSTNGIFNGVMPEWDEVGPLPSTTEHELANIFFSATQGGPGSPDDDLGQVIKREFRGRSPHFYQSDLTPSFVVVPEPSGFVLAIIPFVVSIIFTLIYCHKP